MGKRRDNIIAAGQKFDGTGEKRPRESYSIDQPEFYQREMPTLFDFTCYDEGKDVLDDPQRSDDLAMMMRYIICVESGFEFARNKVFGHPRTLMVEQIAAYLGLGGRSTMYAMIKQWREQKGLQTLRDNMLVMEQEDWDITLHSLLRRRHAIYNNIADIAEFQRGKTAVDAALFFKDIVEPQWEKMQQQRGNKEKTAADFIQERAALPGGTRTD